MGARAGGMDTASSVLTRRRPARRPTGPSVVIWGETKNRYERRVALVPEDVGGLVRQGIPVDVVSSPIRIFPMEAYLEAGARRVYAIPPRAKLVAAVKEMPWQVFRRGTAYMFFSHSYRGENHWYNMHMLRKLMERGATLIDYEFMVDKAGNRIIAFSKFAGMAGINDTLHLLGLRLAAKGIARNPFLELRQTYQYENGVPEMKEHMRRIGQKIKRFGMPKGTGPLVVAFVGYGRVIGGALEVFSAMGAEEISAEVLRAGADKLDSKKIYYVVLKEGDTVIPKPSSSVCSQPFDVTYYRQHPDEYDPNMEGIMRNATVVINGIKWEAEQPHLVSSALLGQLMEEGIEVVIGDVSCDIGGGFESTVIGTTIEDPYYVFDPRDGSHVMGWKGPGFAVNAVDASPGELPAESSRYFSEILARLIPGIMRVDLRGDFDESVFDPCVASAVEVWNGQLTPRFADRPGLVDGLRRFGGRPFSHDW